MKIIDLIYGKTQVKCPRCGDKLVRNRLKETHVNRCAKGCGVWIDQQQLDLLAGVKAKRYQIDNDLPPTSWDPNSAI